MKRQQIIVAAGGVVLLTILYFFGNTVPPVKKPVAATEENSSVITTDQILQASKQRLDAQQQAFVNRLENSVVRGDVKTQQLEAYRQLASFWKDSVQNAFLPSAYYMGEAAKLENSEKSLTFAARLFLENLPNQDNPGLKSWMATQARLLFQDALRLNPANDSTKIGIGASYIFGSAAGNPQEVMQGIQQILEVARRDSLNMYAQFMLGLGGMVSGQLDKAIDRFTTVVRHEPANVEAVVSLAETYERKGDKQAAVTWYKKARTLVQNPEIVKELDKRINALQ